jgi:hypothetical protein
MLINSNFRILFSLLLLLLFSVPSTYSQSTSYLDSLDGKYALQFQISDNFNLTNFQGATLSGKYQLGRRSAVRVGLSINLNNSDAETNQTFIDTSLTISSTGNQHAFGMTVRTQYIHYIPGMYDIAFYIGGGPFVGFNNVTSEDSYTNNPIYRKTTIEDFTVGLDLIAGVEWIFVKDMSLSAEYGIRFSYDSYTRKLEDDYSTSETTIKRYIIDNGDINFGITVYF